MCYYSIVCTIYNDEKDIESFIDNIVHQNLSPSEIIVVDGGSTDNSLEIIQTQMNRYSCIRLIQEGRVSISQGLNEGIRHVRYEIFGIAAVGNRYSENFFCELINTINEGYDIAFSPLRGESKTGFQRLYNRTFLKTKNGKPIRMASNHGVVMKKTAYDRMGYFCERFVYAGEDAEFYSRATTLGLNMKCNDNATVYWDTPIDLYEFKKQIRLYCIADMQMRVYQRTLRDCLIVVSAIGIGVLCSIYFSCPILFFVGAVLFLLTCFVKKSCELGPAILLFFRTWLRAFYVIRYSRYFSSRYYIEKS